MGPVSEGIVTSVILGEVHPLRFETFCNALVSEIEGGVPVVPTSRSWDLGRDGRDAQGTGLFVCATLEARISTKSVDDIERLAGTAVRISRVYFCSSKLLSDKKCVDIETSLRALLPSGVTVTAHGAAQLAALALRSPGLVSRQYQAEIDETLALIGGDTPDREPEDEALRLSLMTLGSAASHEIRRSLYFGVLCSVLAGGPRTPAECARDVSARLRLQRNLPWEVLEHYLDELSQAGDVSLRDGRYSLSEAGHLRLKSSEAEAAAHIIDGKTRLRAAIEKSLGSKLLDQQYDKIWVVIRQKMSHSFYIRGRQMVEKWGGYSMMSRPPQH